MGLLSGFTPGGMFKSLIEGLTGPLFNWLGRKEDAGVSNRATDAKLIGRVVDNALKARAIEANLILQLMKHPLWWIAYILFVIPPGFYHASIFFVSIFDSFLNVPNCAARCAWYVKRVPPEQEELARQAVAFVLGSHVATGFVGTITQTISRFAKGGK